MPTGFIVIWLGLLRDTLAALWSQASAVIATIQTVVFLSWHFSRRTSKRIDRLTKRRFRVRHVVAFVGSWFVLLLMHTVYLRISTAEARVQAFQERPAPETARVSLDPNPQLTAKIAEQEGQITRLSSEKRDLQRDLDAARQQVDRIKEQLRQRAVATHESQKRAGILLQLSARLDQGRSLRGRYVGGQGSQEAEKAFDVWDAECHKYINDNLGADYAAQYRQPASSAPVIDGFSLEKMRVVNRIDSRLKHLGDFINWLH